MLPCLAPALWMMFIPGLASAQSAEAQRSTPGAIQGAVTDSSGSAVAGAIVTLETAASTWSKLVISPFHGQDAVRRLSTLRPRLGIADCHGADNYRWGLGLFKTNTTSADEESGARLFSLVSTQSSGILLPCTSP